LLNVQIFSAARITAGGDRCNWPTVQRSRQGYSVIQP
jgi:hypothetical protein